MTSKGAETRERILDTAFRMAARDGLAGLSLGELAGQLKMSKSGLFAHFGSKEELQIDLLRTGAGRFVERVMLPAFQRPRGLPRLKQIFANWMQWANDPALPGGCLMMAAAIELDDSEGPVRETLVALQKEFLAALGKSALIGIEEGHLRRGLDVDQFAFEMYSILLGFNHARRLLRDPKAEKRARDAFARLLESSFAPD